MGSFPPNNVKQWIRVLLRLGFVKVTRIGRGKHVNKFVHADRHTLDYKKQPDFIIIPHKIYPQMSAFIVKELTYFGFSEEDVRNAC